MTVAIYSRQRFCPSLLIITGYKVHVHYVYTIKRFTVLTFQCFGSHQLRALVSLPVHQVGLAHNSNLNSPVNVYHISSRLDSQHLLLVLCNENEARNDRQSWRFQHYITLLLDLVQKSVNLLMHAALFGPNNESMMDDILKMQDPHVMSLLGVCLDSRLRLCLIWQMEVFYM